MSEPLPPTFLVSAYSDPVVVQIHGKANYLNCNTFREFIEGMVSAGKAHIVLDFENCRGMDSTFLGILAGTALDLRKQTPPGLLIICKLGERNHELVSNLGLQNILTIGEDLQDCADHSAEFSPLKDMEISIAKNVLAAHENLIKVDSANAAKFQDVIAFLKNQIETKGEQ